MKGVVIKVIYNRGFGFIRGDDHVSRYFHVSEVRPTELVFDTLKIGDAVEFDPDMVAASETTGNGARATNVRLS
jgi:cold shock CspA family protein